MSTLSILKHIILCLALIYLDICVAFPVDYYTVHCRGVRNVANLQIDHIFECFKFVPA